MIWSAPVLSVAKACIRGHSHRLARGLRESAGLRLASGPLSLCATSAMERSSLPCDRELARRLERAEALANARFVETRARLAPRSGACWLDVAGTWAMFDGVDSPVTQTFG